MNYGAVLEFALAGMSIALAIKNRDSYISVLSWAVAGVLFGFSLTLALST